MIPGHPNEHNDLHLNYFHDRMRDETRANITHKDDNVRHNMLELMSDEGNVNPLDNIDANIFEISSDIFTYVD